MQKTDDAYLKFMLAECYNSEEVGCLPQSGEFIRAQPAACPGKSLILFPTVWYNRYMDYCISDIHGYYDLFCRLMDKIGFGGGDRLFVLGDMIDKGPSGIRLAKLLFSLPNVYCIAGNHEYDFLKYYHALMRQSEDYDRVLETLRGYFADGDLLDWETVDKLDFLPYYVETEDFIGVHAGVPVKDGALLPVSQATCEQLVYDRRFKDADVLPQNGKCVFYGHTPVRYLTGRDEILFYPRAGAPRGSRDIADYCKVHLDTGVFLGGVLGCAAVGSCRCFYAEERPF